MACFHSKEGHSQIIQYAHGLVPAHGATQTMVAGVLPNQGQFKYLRQIAIKDSVGNRIPEMMELDCCDCD
jgi:hypothetical protein